MSPDRRFAHVVDDEAAMRRSLALLLQAAGYEVQTFATGDAFLAAAAGDLPFGCVLLDLRMPGMDGLAVQRAMAARRLAHPVVVITAHGTVPAAVQAMKAGARDVLEKPFSGEELLRAAQSALERRHASLAAPWEAEEAEARLASLSPREMEVLRGLLGGCQNKVIALDLGISPRTVEIHRGNLMAKLGVRSLPDAVRIALAAGLRPDSRTG